MRKLLVFLIVLALLFAGVSSAWAIKGRVIDSAGKPVPNATVRVVSCVFGRSIPEVANDQGRFSYTQVYGSKRVNYSITVLDGDGRPMSRARVMWPPFPSRRTTVVHTNNGGWFNAKTPSVKGSVGCYGFKVRDASGALAPKSILELAAGPGFSEEHITMSEKGEGSYSQKAYSQTRLTVIADGFAFGRKQNEGNAPVTIKLLPERRATGSIVGDYGRPLAGASVAMTNLSFKDDVEYLSYDVMFPDDFSNTSAITDRQGRFVLHHLPEVSADPGGSIFMTITKPGYAPLRLGSSLQDLPMKLSSVQMASNVVQK